MNFIKAIQHATIGYAIRRTAWPKQEAMLHLTDDGELHWCDTHGSGDTHAELCGEDRALHLTPEDIRAADWETI